MTHIIYSQMLEKAGITREKINQGNPDSIFTAICKAMHDIHQGKEVDYGNYIANMESGDPQDMLREHYFNVKRKWVRYQNHIEQMNKTGEVNLSEWLDTLADLAVYGVMGVQLLDCIMKGEE